jgi:DNA topoisomerase-1
VLGNTPAVCRKAYIHPAVLAAYEAGELTLNAGASDRAFELAVLTFLEEARDAQAGRKPA